MAEKKTYKVLHRLDGDRLYEAGETRELTATDAKHLLDLGAIEEVGAEAAPAEDPKEEPVEYEHHEIAKAEEAPLNKAEAAAPAKKGRRG